MPKVYLPLSLEKSKEWKNKSRKKFFCLAASDSKNYFSLSKEKSDFRFDKIEIGRDWIDLGGGGWHRVFYPTNGVKVWR